MATKNIVPRANAQGQLGTDAKKWLKHIAVTGSFTAISGSISGNELTLVSGSVTSTGSFGRVVATTFSGEGSGITGVTATAAAGTVSSSAQIATQISGSLGANASIIRGLTNAGISGSFTDVSSSLASRVKANEDIVKGKTILSQSAQIKDEISGSFTSASSSLAGRISTVEGTGTIQGVGQSDNVTFNKITTTSGTDVFGGNVTVAGDLTVAGDQTQAASLVIADVFGFFASGSQSSPTDAGILVQSGSNAMTGSAMYHDVHNAGTVRNLKGGRWAVSKDVKADDNAAAPKAFVTTVVTATDANDPDSTDVHYGVGEMYVNSDGEIWVYTGS